MAAVAQQIAKPRSVGGGAGDQDLPSSRAHQGGEQRIDRRLVVHRHQLLAHDPRRWPEPEAGCAGEYVCVSAHMGAGVARSPADVSRRVSTPSRDSDTTMLAAIHIRERFTRQSMTTTQRLTMRFLLFTAFTSSASRMLRMRM